MIDNYILTPYPDQAMKGYDLTNGEYTTDRYNDFVKEVSPYQFIANDGSAQVLTSIESLGTEQGLIIKIPWGSQLARQGFHRFGFVLNIHSDFITDLDIDVTLSYRSDRMTIINSATEYPESFSASGSKSRISFISDQAVDRDGTGETTAGTLYTD
jgi:hypothetical protein